MRVQGRHFIHCFNSCQRNVPNLYGFPDTPVQLERNKISGNVKIGKNSTGSATKQTYTIIIIFFRRAFYHLSGVLVRISTTSSCLLFGIYNLFFEPGSLGMLEIYISILVVLYYVCLTYLTCIMQCKWMRYWMSI